MTQKEYLIKQEDGSFISQKVIGFIPPNSIGLMIQGEEARWIKIGNITDPETGIVTQGPIVDETLKASLQAQDIVDQVVVDKATQVTAKYSEMSDAVYSQMSSIFYTKKSDSAAANYEMWKHMVANASLYSAKGLKAEYQLNNADATELYSPGSALDTDPKIVAYATRKLEEADEYIVWRSDRIQQFRNERDIINT